MTQIVLNAEGAVVGRLASYAAKQALLGRNVVIVNCEKAVISGSPRFVTQRALKRSEYLGQPFKGPHFPRVPDRFVRRIVRGMLPTQGRRGRGREAFSRVLCYVGVPKEFEGKAIQAPFASSERLEENKAVTVGEVCKTIGGLK